MHIFTGCNEVVAKVMFLPMSVSVHRGGAIPACIAGGIPACLAGLQQVCSGGVSALGEVSAPGGVCCRGCLLQRGLLWGVSALGGVCSGGCLLWGVCLVWGVWPFVMAFWSSGLLVWWPSGLVAFWSGAFWFGGLLVESGLLVWWPSGWKWSSGLVAFWFGGLLVESGLLVWWPSGWKWVFCSGLLVWSCYGLLVLGAQSPPAYGQWAAGMHPTRMHSCPYYFSFLPITSHRQYWRLMINGR